MSSLAFTPVRKLATDLHFCDFLTSFMNLFIAACVLNIISHNRAYSLYPRATFAHRLTAHLRPPDDRILSAIQKYADRGWTATNELPGEEGWTTLRRVGDNICWMIPLKKRPAPINNTLTTNTWMQFLSDGPGIPSFPYHLTIKANNLFFSYTVADDTVWALIDDLIGRPEGGNPCDGSMNLAFRRFIATV
jgi:hypothetical protein